MASRTIEQASRRLAHVNLLVTGAEQQAAVLQRLDHLQRQRTSTRRDRADRAVGIVEGVLGEARERRLIGLRIALGIPLGIRAERSGQSQGDSEYDRDDAFVRRHFVPNPGFEWRRR